MAAAALAAQIATPAKTPVQATEANKAASAATAAQSKPSVLREGTMLQTQWAGSPRSRTYGYSPQFGTSSRGPRGFFDGLFDSDDEDRPQSHTYRTVCVRMCDGYFFPVSFSAGPERFERDRRVCESSCGTQGRLFTYRNPGGDIEDMQDLQGRAYRQLPTAFLYRTQYVADCKCKPHPWEEQATDQHRAYALAAAKRKGDKAAGAELAALEAKMRQNEKSSQAAAQNSKTAGKPAKVVQLPAGDVRPDPGVPVGQDDEPAQRPRQSASDATLMRLGAEERRAARAQQSRKPAGSWEGEWSSKRTFWKDF